MDTIFWIQNKSITGEDILYVDGEPCEKDRRSEVMSFLLNNRVPSATLFKTKKNEHQWHPLLKYFKDVVNECLEKGTPVSSNLMCYIDNDKSLMIRGNFNDKDDAGRRTVYTFYANTPDVEISLKRLKELALSLGKSCNEYDFVAIREAHKKYIEKKKISKYIILILIIIAICAIIMFLN